MSLLETIEQAHSLLSADRARLEASERDPQGVLPADIIDELVEYDQAMAGLQLIGEILAELVPDGETLRRNPAYLIELVERSGLSTRSVARRIGIDDGELRGYLSGRRTWPYPVQFAIEVLARRV